MVKFFVDLSLRGKLIAMMVAVSTLGLIAAVTLFAVHRTTPDSQSLLPCLVIAGAIVLCVSAIALWLALWAKRFVLKPIHEIIAATEAFTQDQPDYSIRVPGAERQDELGTLIRGFNAMVAHIENSDGEVKAVHAELENRVEKRTRELIEEIKQRRNTEAELLNARDKAQKYLDMAGVMLVALDTEANVTMLNRKGTEITGYTEAELLGRNWFEVMLPQEVAAAVKMMFNDAMSGRGRLPDNFENAIVGRDGDQHMIQWHNTLLISADGDVIGALSSGRDITEQSKIEEESRRAQKLETIGTFAGGIAHDFNNFLMVIHGSIELAQMSLDNPSLVDKLLNDAVAAAGRARGLTRQLITFSKGGQPQKRTVKLAGTVRETVSFVLTGSNVTADIAVPDDLWLAHVDTGQIEQVLTNLVVNAKQAMPDGGVIHAHLANVLTEEAEERGMPRQPFVEVAIRDEGPGISADILPNVFDPYFTTKQEGSGLGLATSYAIVSQHGGHVTVDSQLGAGSTFRMYLPAAVEQGKTESKDSHSGELSRSYNILLMDDEPMVAEVIKVMLERLKCRASWAKDGEEAVRMYAKASTTDDPFDAVILDIIVPAGMGGKGASKELLKMDPSAKLIVSSAYSNDPLMAEHKENGFRACLAKPYNHRELEKVLIAILEPDGLEVAAGI